MSAFGTENIDFKSRFIGVSSGGSASLNKDGLELKGKLGIDVMNYEDKDVQVRVGLNADTGGSITNDGIEGKFLGFGASLGKKTGISTPFGEVKVNTDDCIVQ